MRLLIFDEFAGIHQLLFGIHPLFAATLTHGIILRIATCNTPGYVGFTILTNFPSRMNRLPVRLPVLVKPGINSSADKGRVAS
jgi:hypothetical protein